MPTELDDICFNKAAIMERCLRWVFAEFRADPSLGSPSHLDALMLNLERACQAAIDLGMHLVARDHLGMPQDSADAFVLLHKAGRLTAETAIALKAMVGFRNVAIHEYQSLNLEVVKAIAGTRWTVFVDFCQESGLRIEPGKE